MSRYGLSQSLYGFAYVPTIKESEIPDDYIEMLKQGVQLGRFPYSTLSIAKNGLLSTGVLPENLNGPSTTELVFPLIGAIFVLLGRTNGTYVSFSLSFYSFIIIIIVCVLMVC